MLRLGLPENHREMVLKCKSYTAALIMNEHGSSSSLSINMEPGVHEPFKVILQLHMYILFFLGGEPRAFIRFSRRFMTQGSFRATNLFLDQMHVYWAEMASKNIIVSRAIIWGTLVTCFLLT